MELRREDLATAAEDQLRWINLLNVPAEGYRMDVCMYSFGRICFAHEL